MDGERRTHPCALDSGNPCRNDVVAEALNKQEVLSLHGKKLKQLRLSFTHCLPGQAQKCALIQ